MRIRLDEVLCFREEECFGEFCAFARKGALAGVVLLRDEVLWWVLRFREA